MRQASFEGKMSLFDEAMKPIKDLFTSNTPSSLCTSSKNGRTHHATSKDLAVQGSTTSNNAESTIALVGAEVGV